MSRRVANLISLICINKNRLGVAVIRNDDNRVFELTRLLSYLHAEYFALTKEEFHMDQIETKWLVFSIAFPEGQLMTNVEYRNVYKLMTHEDRETHMAVQVDAAIDCEVEQALLLDKPKPLKRRIG